VLAFSHRRQRRDGERKGEKKLPLYLDRERRKKEKKAARVTIISDPARSDKKLLPELFK